MSQKSSTIILVLVAVMLSGLVSIGLTNDILAQGNKSSGNHDNNGGKHHNN